LGRRQFTRHGEGAPQKNPLLVERNGRSRLFFGFLDLLGGSRVVFFGLLAVRFAFLLIRVFLVRFRIFIAHDVPP